VQSCQLRASKDGVIWFMMIVALGLVVIGSLTVICYVTITAAGIVCTQQQCCAARQSLFDRAWLAQRVSTTTCLSGQVDMYRIGPASL
jgi:hypothetical protein